MTALNTYAAPNELIKRYDFSVQVRMENEEWIDLDVYEVKVDMHQVRKASMSQFDFDGKVEVKIEYLKEVDMDKVNIRPASKSFTYNQEERIIYLTLTNPCKLSIEVNDDLFHNLHLFANPIEKRSPNPKDNNVLVLQPGIHRPMDIISQLSNKDKGNAYDTIYFSPGAHYIEEVILDIPSDTHVYLAGGSVVVGSMLCNGVRNVSITGRGTIFLSNLERFTAFRGFRIVSSSNIFIDGILVLDPPHYSIFIGSSKHIQISNFKSFGTRGWSDGIDIMSSAEITITDIFMRNSDDCIAIYGSRWDFYGDTSNIKVENAILWADVAHPINIGTHGDYEKEGDTIEHIRFNNIHILEHHEPQENYWGAISLNAGDNNTIQDIVFENIFVDDFELGQLIDIRVVFNKDYNPKPGYRINNVLFSKVAYKGKNTNPSRIFGYDKDRTVSDIRFEGLKINGIKVKNKQEANIITNAYVNPITFE